jgi:indolepyruvate ferredoxin oxidoreductase beta subunit
MNNFNIYLTGVGGQGIGLLSETLMRAADHAGLKVKAVDTHGLAQRGGVVVSQIRIGENINSPMIMAARADMLVALERNEAMRGMCSALKDGGTAVYYDVVWQPLEVRLGQSEDVSNEMIDEYGRKHGMHIVRVEDRELPDSRMQNVVVLAAVDRHNLVPGVDTSHYRQAMEDLMEGSLLEKNMSLFEKSLAS